MHILKGNPINIEQTIELGDSVITEASYYISGKEWTIEHTGVDASGVNNMKVGDYEIKATNPFAEYTYIVHVRDTTPPELEIGESSKTVLAAGQEYSTDIIGAKAEDLSGLAFIRYLYDGHETDSFLFAEPGRYDVTVRATDANANKTEKEVELFVDTPPEFYGVHDQYVLRGSEESALEPVFAYDEVDGGLTSEIVTDASGVDFNNIGTYRLSYEAQDGYGLKSVSSCSVHIVSSAQRVKAHEDDVSLSKEELSHIVEEEYFAYEPLDSPDRKWVQENCDMTLVNLFVNREDGSTSSGSAFIYDITPEYIYMISVYHVTGFLEGERVQIMFYDGSKVYMTMHSIRLNAGNEASLIRLPISEVPYHTLVRLKQVATSDEIYDTVKAGSQLIEFCKNWRGGEVKDLIKYVQVISFTLSPIQSRYVDNNEYYTATRKSLSGMSGTAVFDYRGILAGICSKTMYPLEAEEPKYRDGCDFVLKVDGIEGLMERVSELDKMEKRD